MTDIFPGAGDGVVTSIARAVTIKKGLKEEVELIIFSFKGAVLKGRAG